MKSSCLILNLCTFLRMRDQFPHPYKTTYNNIIFIFWLLCYSCHPAKNIMQLKLFLWFINPWKRMGIFGIWLHIFLILTPDEGKWSTSRLGRSTPEKEHLYPLDRRLSEPCTWSWYCGEQQILAPAGNRPSTPESNPYPDHYTDWTIWCPKYRCNHVDILCLCNGTR
jgi:hypothetical protein